MLAPKGFTQSISKEAYTAARMTASTKSGVLRFRLPLILLAAALVLGGGKTLFESGGGIAYLMTGLVLVLVGLVCAVTAMYILPSQVRLAVEQDYRSFAALSDPAQITFESDEMHIQGACLSRRVEYAKTRVCIETSDRFVILTDDDTVVMLEKSCFEDTDATTAFLRDVFARWYKRG